MTEPSESEPVRVEEADGVAVVTIDRPKALNALSEAVLLALQAAFAELATRGPALRGVILTGGGDRAFVAGADIRGMAALTPAEGARLARLGHAVAHAIEALDAPVVAAVDGFALGGGCELALACDFVYATERSKFGQPEVKLGLIPGFGGTVRLPRAVGLARAKELVYTGRTIDAEEAHRIGLVARLFADRAALDAGVRATLGLIAANAAPAVAMAKHVFVDAAGRDTAAAVDLEVEGFERAFGTADRDEGVAAFLEKREPRFTGR